MKMVLFHIISLLLIGCCEKSVEPTITNNLPEGIEGYTSFNYEYLNTAPLHTQTSMLSGYQNNLYRIGSMFPVQVLNLSYNTWSEIQLPDSSFWRWDGAAVTITDSIFIVATSAVSNSYDILKLELSSQSLHHTDVFMPTNFHYPAYCSFNEKIIFFPLSSDSVYEFNTANNSLNKVAENPFFYLTDVNQSLSSGESGLYFYVFGGFTNRPENFFYRMNLTNYMWEKLFIPPILEKKELIGASFGEQFILFADSTSTYSYSFLDMKWYLDTSYVPIYSRSLSGELIRGEWSFFDADTCIYGTEIISDKIWKIF